MLVDDDQLQLVGMEYSDTTFMHVESTGPNTPISILPDGPKKILYMGSITSVINRSIGFSNVVDCK